MRILHRAGSPCGETSDVASLPGGFDCSSVVVLADVCHCDVSGQAVEGRQACQGGSRPTSAAMTSHLYPLCISALKCLAESVLGIFTVGGQTEIWPRHPAPLPRHRWRRVAEKVQSKLRIALTGHGLPKSPTANEPTRGESEDSALRGMPADHDEEDMTFYTHSRPHRLRIRLRVESVAVDDPCQSPSITSSTSSSEKVGRPLGRPCSSHARRARDRFRPARTVCLGRLPGGTLGRGLGCGIGGVLAATPATPAASASPPAWTASRTAASAR